MPRTVPVSVHDREFATRALPGFAIEALPAAAWAGTRACAWLYASEAQCRVVGVIVIMGRADVDVDVVINVASSQTGFDRDRHAHDI